MSSCSTVYPAPFHRDGFLLKILNPWLRWRVWTCTWLVIKYHPLRYPVLHWERLVDCNVCGKRKNWRYQNVCGKRKNWQYLVCSANPSSEHKMQCCCMNIQLLTFHTILCLNSRPTNRPGREGRLSLLRLLHFITIWPSFLERSLVISQYSSAIPEEDD